MSHCYPYSSLDVTACSSSCQMVAVASYCCSCSALVVAACCSLFSQPRAVFYMPACCSTFDVATCCCSCSTTLDVCLACCLSLRLMLDTQRGRLLPLLLDTRRGVLLLMRGSRWCLVLSIVAACVRHSTWSLATTHARCSTWPLIAAQPRRTHARRLAFLCAFSRCRSRA